LIVSGSNIYCCILVWLYLDLTSTFVFWFDCESRSCVWWDCL